MPIRNLKRLPEIGGLNGRSQKLVNAASVVPATFYAPRDAGQTGANILNLTWFTVKGVVSVPQYARSTL